MNARRSVLRLVALAVVVSMPLMGLSGTAQAKSAPHRHHHHHPAGGGSGGGTGGSPAPITVAVSPNPIVETGSPTPCVSEGAKAKAAKPRVKAQQICCASQCDGANIAAPSKAHLKRIGAVPLLTSDGSDVYAVIEVETSPSFAGDPVDIQSSQLQAACGGIIQFETLQGATVGNPTTSFNSISVILDNDGNVTVVVNGTDCAPGPSLVEADLAVAPFITATTTLLALPPSVTPEGVTGSPNKEVETGDTAASGDSNVYAIFYVETNPVYAEQPVEISSPQLEARCIEGWRWEPEGGVVADGTGVNPSPPQSTLDDDGNTVFVFKGASCAAGDSVVTADVEAGPHTTYTMTYTIDPPVPTI